MKRLVSVLIPYRNMGVFIEECLESCARQASSTVAVEVIVIDDGSEDLGEAQWAELRDRFPNLVYKRFERRMGASATRNEAIKASTGDFIQFLDADDYLLEGKFERQLTALEESSADFVYSDWEFLYHERSGLRRSPGLSPPPSGDYAAACLEGWWTATASLLYRREAVEAIGPWDQAVEGADDRDYFTRAILQRRLRLVHVPGLFSVYRKTGGASLASPCNPGWHAGHLLVSRKIVAILAPRPEDVGLRNVLMRSFGRYGPLLAAHEGVSAFLGFARDTESLLGVPMGGTYDRKHRVLVSVLGYRLGTILRGALSRAGWALRGRRRA